MSTVKDKQRILLTELTKFERKESQLRFNGLPNCYEDYAFMYGQDWKIAGQINKNAYRRKAKVQNKIKKSIEGKKAVFITFTFRDDVMDTTSEQTRRRYIARCLKEASSRYVANIDFGTSTEREHYHAVVETEHFDMALWPYGFAYCKRIRAKSEVAIAKYISKLSNHAIKNTARSVRLIYSRRTIQS